ncbi:unnamed protein product [Debaryomyces tyrocola]|nr:unnamed protein product [Debaryomyces tyrocola]
MDGDVFAKNIRQYILRGGEDADIDVGVETDMDKDVDTFEIT